MKKVLLILLALVALFAIYVTLQPGTYRVERSASVVASPATVYAAISDFHRWPDWSPWEKLDPQMQREMSGAPEGVGAVYAWKGNDKVGEGRMTITEVNPGQDVTIKLEFLKPWEATNTTRFTLEPDAAGTQVRWTMDGNHNFISKAMCVFTPMDKMIGPDFERGLAQLKSLAEASEPAPADTSAAPAS